VGVGSKELVSGGADGAKFEIVGTALYLKDGVVLDHATQPNLSVTVSASDPTVAGSTPVSTAYTLAITQTGPVAGNVQVIGEDTILGLTQLFGNNPLTDPQPTGFSALHGTFEVIDTRVVGPQGQVSGTLVATYTPNANYHGSDTISYTLAGVPQTIDVLVTPVNDAPTGGVAVTGEAVLGGVLSADTSTLADADGLGTLHYVWERS